MIFSSLASVAKTATEIRSRCDDDLFCVIVLQLRRAKIKYMQIPNDRKSRFFVFVSKVKSNAFGNHRYTTLNGMVCVFVFHTKFCSISMEN